MPEKLVDVRSYGLHYDCDVVNCDGIMAFTGRQFSQQPPLLEHVCTTCKGVRMLSKAYPGIWHWPAATPLPDEMAKIYVGAPPAEPEKKIELPDGVKH